MREKPNELHRAFISPFNHTDFLWTGELFVARQPLYRIPKRPGGERGDFNRVVMLDTLLSAHQNLLLVEQPHRQTSLPQHRLRRKAQFLELSWQRGRDSKSIRHRSPNSINLHPYSALNRSWYCSSLTFSIQSTTLPSFFS